MKVLFDTQIFDWQINGGISRYFYETMKVLNEMKEVDVLFKCRHSYNSYIQNSQWLDCRPVARNIRFKGSLAIVKKVNELVNRKYSNRLLKSNTDLIFHPTYFDPYFLRLLKGKPFVLTVHDLTNEKYPDNTPLTRKMLRWKKVLINAADHIITVSGNTKRDVMEYYNIPEKKITVAHLASPFREEDLQAARKIDPGGIFNSKPYILFVGSRKGYKNFNAFVKEAAPVLLKENFNLIIAGGGALNPAELDLIEKSNLTGSVTALSHISDSLLIQLYQRAALFVFPSIYEGFGIPVLEAMQCGCPVLANNASSLPEVGGTAAEYFDASKPGELTASLIRVLNSQQKRDEMIRLGLEQVKKFSWHNTAIAHLEVYQSLAKTKRS